MQINRVVVQMFGPTETHPDRLRKANTLMRMEW